MRRYVGFILIILCSLKAFAQDGGATPTFQLSGDVKLLSHYVENGLSQTDKAPALQGNFWFNMGPQFRLGLFGTNTDYPGSDDQFNLRATADIKVDFSSTSFLRIAYAQSQYYNGGDRNGNILSAHISFLNDYRILYESYSNWEGTDEKSVRYAFGKVTTIFGTWKWDNEIGYNTPDAAAFKSYFDGKTGLGTNWGVIFFEAALTGTNEAAQFNGAGDLFLILSAKTAL